MIYRLGKKKNLKAEINVVPYIDVMLVLLIIFMVLSPLLIQGIEVNLPKTDTTKMSVQNEPLVISINKNGKYFINVGEESLSIDLDELKCTLLLAAIVSFKDAANPHIPIETIAVANKADQIGR